MKDKKYCACGCGEEIIPKRHHRWSGVPKYLNGHNSRVNHPNWQGGLTNNIEYQKERKKKYRRLEYVMDKNRQHKNSKYKSKPKTNVCNCGCGTKIAFDRLYSHGHENRKYKVCAECGKRVWRYVGRTIKNKHNKLYCSMKCFRIGVKRIKDFKYSNTELCRAGDFFFRMGLNQKEIDTELLKTVVLYNRTLKTLKIRSPQ